jgi:hypothetical protein
MSIKRWWCLSGGFYLLLTGCGPAHLGDLRYVSVKMIELNREPELSSHPRDSRFSDLLLRLEFGSNINFIQSASKYGYNMGVFIRWCKEGAKGREMEDGFPYFYLGDLEVNGASLKETRYPSIVSAKGELFIYHAYFHVNQLILVDRMSEKVSEPYPPYDLTMQPEDICLSVHGGNMIGGYGTSGVVVFPKEAIAKALLRYEKQ